MFGRSELNLLRSRSKAAGPAASLYICSAVARFRAQPACSRSSKSAAGRTSEDDVERRLSQLRLKDDLGRVEGHAALSSVECRECDGDEGASGE